MSEPGAKWPLCCPLSADKEFKSRLNYKEKKKDKSKNTLGFQYVIKEMSDGIKELQTHSPFSGMFVQGQIFCSDLLL